MIGKGEAEEIHDQWKSTDHITVEGEDAHWVIRDLETSVHRRNKVSRWCNSASFSEQTVWRGSPSWWTPQGEMKPAKHRGPEDGRSAIRVWKSVATFHLFSPPFAAKPSTSKRWNMSTDAFINGLWCFIAIIGVLCSIRVDRGSSFAGADHELEEALKYVNTNHLTMFFGWETVRLEHEACGRDKSKQWGMFFGPVFRPHQAGLTVLPRGCSFMRQQPLWTTSVILTAQSRWTPKHLLDIKSMVGLPSPARFIREDLYARKRWPRVQYLAEQFGSWWRREDFCNIATRQHWDTPRRNLQVGDIDKRRMTCLAISGGCLKVWRGHCYRRKL